MTAANARDELSLPAMEIVAGESIDPAELNKPEWATIRHRQRTFLDGANNLSASPATSNPVQRINGSHYTRRGPPATPLPESDIKVVLRPRGGLDLRSVAQASLADAVFRQANIQQNPTDQIRVQHVANFLLISTPSEERAQKYSAIQSLSLKGRLYEVVTHVPAPSNTATGVIFNIPEDDTPDEIYRSIIDYNPDIRILSAKRLGTSTMAQILFDGPRVPYWIRYRAATYRCKPFRRKTEACTSCWQTGHRQDVCPTADATPRCSKCGTPNPDEPHRCTPKCIVCDGPHLTGSSECPRRFQPRKHRQTYAQVAASGQDQRDTHPLQTGGASQEAHPGTSSRKPTQTEGGTKKPPPGLQKSNKQQPMQPPTNPTPGGENKVSGPSTNSHCSPHTQQPPQSISSDILKELANIRAEITLLRQENASLRQENRSLKLQIENRTREDPAPNPPPPKRRATLDAPEAAAKKSTRDEQIDKQFAALEQNAVSYRQTLVEQKNEYLGLCQALQANLSTLQSSLTSGIEELRSEMHTYMRDVLSRINNPMGYNPSVTTHYEPAHQ